MKQEEKELLLTDISGRLPYGLIVQISLFRNDGRKRDIDLDPHVTENIWEIIDKYHALPYLRPMSSMTEEEIVEINSMGFAYWTTMINNDLRTRGPMSLLDAIITHHKMVKLTDWLNAHHFDHRHLIEKGLALEAPEGMYNIKKNNKYDR